MSTVKKPNLRFRVGDPVSFLYGAEMVTGKIVEDRGPLGTSGRRIYRIEAPFGEEEDASFELPEDNLLEPSQDHQEATPGHRREFRIVYAREGKTNRWAASVKGGKTYQAMRAKGAVAYTTARRNGERQEDEIHGIVSVLLKPKPDLSEDAMIAEARRLADRMFLERHPGAEIVS